jgi:hypothetical protein
LAKDHQAHKKENTNADAAAARDEPGFLPSPAE